MNVHLRPEQEAAISQLAADTGRQTDELVQDAVNSLLEQDARFRGAVRRGIEQADRGELINEDDIEAVMERMLQS
jgi:predicted transcriptional regulator